MRLSIVILNWNGSAYLQRFLPVLLRHTPADGVEVVVADNGSTDDSLDVLERGFPSVRVMPLERNYGFAEGYDKALFRLESDYFLLLNSDVEVTEGWLQPLLDYMDAHRDVAACQPKIRAFHRRTHFEYAGAAGGFIDRLGYPFCRGRVLGTVEEDRGQYDAACDVFWASGACLLVRAKDFWEAGALDAGFFAHMEEIDLCWRLRSRGRRVVCVPQSVVYHVGGATLSKGSPRKTFLNFRNNLLMLYKNLPDKELRSVLRVRRVLDWLAAAAFLVQGRVGDFRAVVRARREYRRMRPLYRAAREENLRAVRLNDIPERRRFSLLWQYYVRGRKFFSALPSR